MNQMRNSWMISGTLMWVIVGVAVYFMVSSKPNGGNVVIAPGSDKVGTDSDDDFPEDNGKAHTEIEVKMTWPESGVADFKFTDRTGEVVSKNDLLGRPWVASFVFINCGGPCPLVTEAVKKLHDLYKDLPVKYVTFTVDPKRDTVEALKKYAEAYKADPERWYFLTGDRDEIYSLIKGSFLMPVGEAPNPEPGWEIIHTTNICLVDSTGRVVGKYNSTDGAAMADLRRDLKRLSELPIQALSNGESQPVSEPRDGVDDAKAAVAEAPQTVGTTK